MLGKDKDLINLGQELGKQGYGGLEPDFRVWAKKRLTRILSRARSPCGQGLGLGQITLILEVKQGQLVRIQIIPYLRKETSGHVSR